MKTLLILLFALSALGGVGSERRLKKLSFHIRGIAPASSDYKELAKTEVVELDAFFDSKTDEYLSHKNHSLKMKSRLNQLFRLGLPSPWEKFPYTSNNALDNLFLSLGQKNLSWNKLLTSKKYKLSILKDAPPFSETNDIGFLGAVLERPELPFSPTGIALGEREFRGFGGQNEARENYLHEFNSSDKRIAGALTTERFFARNINTALNKNRKRAAAVFRIFLCDEMEAAIAETDNNFDFLLDLVFPKTGSITSSDAVAVLNNENDHGNRADCMSCHYKLDPMGKNFGGSGVSLAPIAFKGALSYETSKGEKVYIKTDGLGDLADELVKQRDYKACQTKHFWNWYIGEDKPLTENTQNELIEAFDKVEGRTNDFVKYITSRSEFYEEKEIAETTRIAVQAKSILKNCNQCHGAMGIPSFSDWPIESTGGDMNYWTRRIKSRLGLNGGRMTMPPAYSPWKPTEEDIKIVNKWIKLGAPNEDGKPQID